MLLSPYSHSKSLKQWRKATLWRIAFLLLSINSVLFGNYEFDDSHWHRLFKAEAEAYQLPEEVKDLLNNELEYLKIETELKAIKELQKENQLDLLDAYNHEYALIESYFRTMELSISLYPNTKKLILEYLNKSTPLLLSAKLHYNLARPYQLDKEIESRIAFLGTPSFPCSTSYYFTIMSRVINEIKKFNDDKFYNLMISRRIMGGMNFSFDIKAGSKLGNYYFDNFKRDKKINQLFELCKKEWESVQ